MIDYKALGLTERQEKQLKRSISYWDKDRTAKNLNAVSNKNARQIASQLKKYYNTSIKKTIKNFEDTYNSLLQAVKDGREPTPADLYNLNKYWEMEAQLTKELQNLGDRHIKLLNEMFEKNYFDVYYSIALKGQTAYSTINKDIVRQLINGVWVEDGKNWSTRIWKNTKLLAETLNEELINCVVGGDTTSQLKKKLLQRFSVSYSNVDSIVRTEIAHIQTQASQHRYKDYGIKMLEVWADKDERRCEVCGKLHQKKFAVTEQAPIPAHPRCRCSIIPVIE